MLEKYQIFLKNHIILNTQVIKLEFKFIKVDIVKKTGKIKFFDETKNFGFIIMDEDQSDIFVHQDDLILGEISLDMLKTLRKVNQ